jgi:hypothetical protein
LQCEELSGKGCLLSSDQNLILIKQGEEETDILVGGGAAYVMYVAGIN